MENKLRGGSHCIRGYGSSPEGDDGLDVLMAFVDMEKSKKF